MLGSSVFSLNLALLMDGIRVAVIGAGCAGLTAANALKRQGIEVVVYEARNRVGGRIFSIPACQNGHPAFAEMSYNGFKTMDSNCFVDAGGSSMHGCKDQDHLVFRRAVHQCIRVPLHSELDSYEGTSVAAWYSMGKRIPQSQILFMHDFFDIVKAKVASYAIKQAEPDRMCLRPVWNRYVKKIWDEHKEAKMTEREEQILFKIEQRWLGMNQSTSNSSLYPITAYVTSDIPDLRKRGIRTRAVQIDKKLASNAKPTLSVASTPSLTSDTTVVDGYYSFLIRHLKQGLNIRLNSAVCAITAEAPNKQEILKHCPKIEVRTTGGEVEKFDFVVVGLPLGVLKSNDPKNKVQFYPNLSTGKEKAIANLGVGVHNKVILRFAERDVFWPHSVPQLNCLDERFQFFNLHAYGKTGVILAHVFSESGYIEKMKQKTDDDVVEEVLSVLYDMFCADGKWSNNVRRTVWESERDKLKSRENFDQGMAMNISSVKPKPSFTFVTRWDTDIHSFGSYSCLPIGVQHSEIAEFRKPEQMGGDKNVIFFAGEHASDPNYGWQCVNGAYDTALMAVHKLLVSAGLRARQEHWSNLDEFSSFGLVQRIQELEESLYKAASMHGEDKKAMEAKIHLLEEKLQSEKQMRKEQTAKKDQEIARLSDALQEEKSSRTTTFLSIRQELESLKASIGYGPSNPEIESGKIAVSGERSTSNTKERMVHANEDRIEESSVQEPLVQEENPTSNVRPPCVMGSRKTQRRCSYCDVKVSGSKKTKAKPRTKKFCTSCDVTVCPKHFEVHVSELQNKRT